jgi:hypothetical protein
MRLILAFIVLLLALPAAAGAQVVDQLPTATTGEATEVTRTSATLNGTVDPNQTDTTYRFEYGTTAALGQRTAEFPAGDGSEPVPVDAQIESLTPATTYHYKIVATNMNGTTAGETRTFRTADPPRAPGVTRTGTASTAPESAVVRSIVDPNGGATTYYFEYGRTRSYGSRTPDRTLPEGDAPVSISETLTGLQPYRRYNFRLVATNSAGTTRSLNRRLTTARRPDAVTLDVEGKVPWGEGVEVFGRVTGIGVNGIPVGLERQDFPFSGPFSSIGTPFPVRADRLGRFRIFVPSLFSTTRLRAVTLTVHRAESRVVTAPVTVRVGAAVRRLSRKRVSIRGSIRPAAPRGRAILQRRSRSGRWTFVRGGRLRPLGESRSRYAFKVQRSRSGPRTFRVRVIARDEGAHYPGHSRRVNVPKAPRRR